MLKRLFNRNSMWLGIGIGFALPLTVYFLFETLQVYLSRDIFDLPVVFSKSTAQLIALFMNVIIFRVYMLRYEYDYTGRGILLATFVYAFVFFYMNRSYVF